MWCITANNDQGRSAIVLVSEVVALCCHGAGLGKICSMLYAPGFRVQSSVGVVIVNQSGNEANTPMMP